ncbi:MAG: MBL fold metallo-hydrolase [Clostridiaceae bacterium]|nr:MBL fold metallo-hydrolase [Clostridiaceae bacterium]
MFIPGFRSRNKGKMVIAAIYYLVALLLGLIDVSFSLFTFSIPFIVFSFLDLIKKKNKKSLYILIVSILVFLGSLSVNSDQGKNIALNDPAPASTAEFSERNTDISEKEIEETEDTGGESLQDDYSIKEQNSENNSNSSTGNQVNGTHPTGQKLKVHFIDVGQADSILIIQNNSTMLIDAGNNADSDLVTQYIKSKGITKLDYVIGTHPHEDHIGGLDAVINNFDIGTVIMPKVAANTRTFEDVVNAIKNKDLKVTAPVPLDEYDLGDAKFVILAPNSDNYEDLNDYSIVVKLTFGNNSFIFTGDAEAVSENEILSKGYNIKADVLKVGHHGSRSSTTENFLRKISPDYAVISVGKDNNYGHPSQEVLNLLKKENISVYRTDERGTIIAISDGNKLSFEFDRDTDIHGGMPVPKPKATPASSPVTTPTPVTTPKPSSSTPKPSPATTPKPAPSSTPSAASDSVIIEKVDLAGEVVTLKNTSSRDVSLAGWKLVSVEGNQVYYFPDDCIIKGGSRLTIASGNASGDIKWTKRNIWNNKGDTAELYDNNGKLVSRK